MKLMQFLNPFKREQKLSLRGELVSAELHASCIHGWALTDIKEDYTWTGYEALIDDTYVVTCVHCGTSQGIGKDTYNKMNRAGLLASTKGRV